MQYADLLGRPWRLHGAGPEGMDCSTVAEEVMRRLGFDPPATSPYRMGAGNGHYEELESCLSDNAAHYELLGAELSDARCEGDLVLVTPYGGNRRGLFVLADAQHGLFLTSTQGSGVVAIGKPILSRLQQEIVGVYRCTRRSPS